MRAVDAAGNQDETPESFSWTVDLPPDTSIDSGPPSATESTSASFVFSSNETGVTYECALDDGSFSSCATPYQLTNLAVGAHTLEVRAVDSNSSVDPTPASYSWTIGAPPNTTITASPVDPTDSTTASFSFTSTPAGTSFECALDGAAFAGCTSPVEYSGLAQGAHDFAVRAVSAAGTPDPTPAEFSWGIGDITPPITSITAGPAATTTETSATFSFTTDDPEAVLQCSLDGAVFSVCTSPRTYTGLALGEHTFEVQGIKQNLVVDPLPATYTWTVEPNTPAGANVAVQLAMPSATTVPSATLSFAEVTAPGDTTVTALTNAPALPSSFQVGALSYDFSTTASFTGQVDICLGYDPTSFTDPAGIRLMHFVGGAWVDVTTTNDPVAGLVCGSVTSLSPFAVAEPATVATPTASAWRSPRRCLACGRRARDGRHADSNQHT